MKNKTINKGLVLGSVARKFIFPLIAHTIPQYELPGLTFSYLWDLLVKVTNVIHILLKLPG